MSELGELVKQELELRDCGHGYDPDTESYTPWYRLRFRVEYVDEIGDGYKGTTNLLKKEIKISDTLETTRALYHEILHADLEPLNIVFRIALPLGTWLYFTHKASDNVYAQLLATFVGLLAVPASIAITDVVSELHISYQEFKKFDLQ